MTSSRQSKQRPETMSLARFSARLTALSTKRPPRSAAGVKDAGAGLVEKGGEVTGTLGEKATGAASSVGAVISDNFDAAVTFAKGLFGG